MFRLELAFLMIASASESKHLNAKAEKGWRLECSIESERFQSFHIGSSSVAIQHFNSHLVNLIFTFRSIYFVFSFTFFMYECILTLA